MTWYIYTKGNDWEISNTFPNSNPDFVMKCRTNKGTSPLILDSENGITAVGNSVFLKNNTVLALDESFSLEICIPYKTQSAFTLERMEINGERLGGKEIETLRHLNQSQVAGYINQRNKSNISVGSCFYTGKLAKYVRSLSDTNSLKSELETLQMAKDADILNLMIENSWPRPKPPKPKPPLSLDLALIGINKVFKRMFRRGASEVNDRGFGMYTIEIEGSNGLKLPPLVLEIYPGYKIGYYYKGNQKQTPKERYEEAQKFFQAMVAKLADSELVLSLLDPAAIPSSSGSKGDKGSVDRKKSIARTEITDYWFFVKHEKKIKKALKHIQRFPHKVLGQKKEFRRIDTITSYDPDLPYEISKAPQYLQPLASPNKRGVCEKNGKRYLPGLVLVNILEETLDNPENRFLMHVVSLFHSKLRGVLEWLEKKSGFTVDKLEKLKTEISSFQCHLDFQHLRQSATEPSQSKVLTKTPGYKEMASIWRQYGGLDFNGGLLLLDTIIRQKKWHDLYELWCFKLLIEKFQRNDIPKLYPKKGDGGKYEYLASYFKFDCNNKSYLLVYQGEVKSCSTQNSSTPIICKCITLNKDEYADIAINLNSHSNVYGRNVPQNWFSLRPDFMIFEEISSGTLGQYTLIYLLDAKFTVAGQMPRASDFLGTTTPPWSPTGPFQNTIVLIFDTYLSKFGVSTGQKVPGGGIFLQGNTNQPVNVAPLTNSGAGGTVSVDSCVSALEVSDSGFANICINCGQNNNSNPNCQLPCRNIF